MFAKAPYRRWATINPCEGVDLPALREPTEIRYLTLPQVDRLLAHVRPGPFAHLDRAIFTTAVMTGLRKGELVALRWRDIDWEARRIRVRRSYTYGEFGTPKSKRSSRSVPMTAELAVELRRVWNQTIWRDDDDLVFAHPDHGGVLPKANISRRLSAALRAAGIENHRFHDLRHTSAPAWPPLASRCARCRSGWATATSPPPSVTPTTRRASTRGGWWRRRLRGLRRGLPAAL